MKKKRKTIGKMANSRVVWTMKPTSRIKPGKQKALNRAEAKQQLKQGKWDD